MKYILFFLSFALLAGCAGKLYTIPDPKPDASGRIYGIIVYQPKPMVFVYETTQYKDANGVVIENKACTPDTSYEVVGVPDYTTPYAVGYDAALFESYKFSLDLNQGVITKVNNDSTSGAKDVLETFKGIVGTALDVAKEVKVMKNEKAEMLPRPKCNAGKKLVGRMDISDIKLLKPGQ